MNAGESFSSGFPYNSKNFEWILLESFQGEAEIEEERWKRKKVGWGTMLAAESVISFWGKVKTMPCKDF